MVYESDFYTTRRPYRAIPSVSSYTVSSVIPSRHVAVPSRQVRIYPGIGRVHVVHSYDRIIPYIGHKRLTVIPTYGTTPPHVFRVRPSVIVREIDRIANKPRPYLYYTPSLVHSEPITYFDHEASLIRAQSNMLLKSIHAPVPRVHAPWPLAKLRYHYDLPTLPSRITPDDYIQRMLTPINSVKQDIYNISHYITSPIRQHIVPYSRLYYSSLYPRLYSTWYPSLYSSLYPRLYSTWYPSLYSSLYPRLYSTWYPSPYSSLYPRYYSRVIPRYYDYYYRYFPYVYRYLWNTLPSVKCCVGPSHLACVRYSGGKPYSRRRNLTLQEIYAMQSDTVRSDIQLLSYYIRANKDRKQREAAKPESVEDAPRTPAIEPTPAPQLTE